MICALFRFLLFFLIGIVLCTIAWGEWVNGNLYTCIDGFYFDFLFPGDWYHGSTSGDTIQPGWTEAKLLMLWWSMVLSVGLISIILTSMTHSTEARIR